MPVNEQTSWPLKPKEIVILIVALAGMGAIFLAAYNAHINELVDAANRTIGMSEPEAIGELGEPWLKHSSAEYNARERALISGSYNPDPPPASAGSVLCYSRGATMVMLFVEGGKVVRVHVCAT